jgi:transcriptional regulator with XRE-family HTH domain
MHNASMPRNPLYEQLQRALQDARKTKNLTQRDVSARLGKPQSYISKYESGERRLDLIEFLEVCEALEIKPDYILLRLGVYDRYGEVDS